MGSDLGSAMGSWLETLLPLIYVLGVCRATQLVMHDKVFEKPRTLIKKLGEYPRFSIECPWCTSTQLALIGAALLAWPATRVATVVVLAALAVSLLAVLVDRLIDRSTYLADEPDKTSARAIMHPAPPPPRGGTPPDNVPAAVRAALGEASARDPYRSSTGG